MPLSDAELNNFWIAWRLSKSISDAALDYLARRHPDLRAPTADRALNDFRLAVVQAYDRRRDNPDEVTVLARSLFKVVQ
jgi:hypothetical protein